MLYIFVFHDKCLLFDTKDQEFFDQNGGGIGSFPSTGLGGGIGLGMVNTENFGVPDRMVGLGESIICQHLHKI